MTSYGYIITIIVDYCMIRFHFDCIMQFINHIILLLMFATEKVLLLLVIFLTKLRTVSQDSCQAPSINKEQWGVVFSTWLYPSHNEVVGGILFHSVRPSVRTSVHLSIHPAWCVCSVAGCLFHGLYSYVTQIQHMRGQCFTYHFQAIRSKVSVTRVVRMFVVGARGMLGDRWSTISYILTIAFNLYCLDISEDKSGNSYLTLKAAITYMYTRLGPHYPCSNRHPNTWGPFS